MHRSDTETKNGGAFYVKGALTAEAAIVIPVFLFSVISLIRLIFLVVFAMRVQMYSDKTLEEYYFLKNASEVLIHTEDTVSAGSSNVSSADPVSLSAEIPKEEPSEPAVRTMMLMHLGTDSAFGAHLMWSVFGLDVSFEDTSDPNLCIMDVDYSPAILRLPGYTFYKKCSSRVVSSKWEGRAYASEPPVDRDYCYVTPYGTVYHLSTKCPYLDLSLSQVSSSRIGEYRNADGKRYEKCSECGGSGPVCYITDYGEVWHSSPACPTLRRTIRRIPQSECGDKKVCGKCEELRAAEYD